MSEDALPVLCARCRVEIEEPTDPGSAGGAFCPSCGLGDTLENIEREISRFIEDQLSDDGAFEDDHQRQADADIRPNGEPHRSYRFVVDLDHLRSELGSHAEEPAIEEAFETESSAGVRR